MAVAWPGKLTWIKLHGVDFVGGHDLLILDAILDSTEHQVAHLATDVGEGVTGTRLWGVALLRQL